MEKEEKIKNEENKDRKLKRNRNQAERDGGITKTDYWEKN